jgi:undecaprenyl-diphosphatase
MTRRGVLWSLLVAGVAGLAVLAAGYNRPPASVIDHDIARWVARNMPSWAESLARPPSWLGGWIGMTALGLVVLVLLSRERAWLDLGFFLTAFLGSQLTVLALKAWFDRPRPQLGSAVPLPLSPAFPSGHATAGVASLGAAAVIFAGRLSSHRARVWLWTVVVVLGLSVGASRVVLGVHYVTDVLAGWCLGVAWLSACLLLREAARARTKDRRIRRDRAVPSPYGRDDAEPGPALRGGRDPARLGP